MENKQLICNLLCKALQATRNQSDLTAITYCYNDDGREIAVLTYINGYTKTVNVAMDSGTAMIRDIMENID